MARFAAFADSKRAYPTVVTAVALNAVGRNDAALAALSRVKATPLTQGWIDQTRYEALRNGDRPEEALALARDLAARSDVSAESFVRLGDALAATDRHAEAANAFKQAIDLVAARHGETFIPWHYWLQYGRELESARDWTKARLALQRAVEAGPDQATPLNHLGYSMLEHGEDAKAATELIARASAIRPDDAPSSIRSAGRGSVRANWPRAYRCSNRLPSASPGWAKSASIWAMPIGCPVVASTPAMRGVMRWCKAMVTLPSD
jgi:tetratricopeptide (TPR) repeat protein